MFFHALTEYFYRSQVLLFSYHIKDPYYHYDSLLLTWTLITWIRQCLSGFSMQLPFCPHPLPHCNLWKEVSEQLHLRSVDLLSLSLYFREEINYLKIFYMRYLSLLPHLFNHLLIAVWIHEYLFNPGSDPILFFFSNYSIFDNWELLSLSGIFLSICVFVYQGEGIKIPPKLSNTTKFYTFILYVSCPSPRISHFSKAPWFLLLKNGIRNHTLALEVLRILLYFNLGSYFPFSSAYK